MNPKLEERQRIRLEKKNPVYETKLESMQWRIDSKI